MVSTTLVGDAPDRPSSESELRGTWGGQEAGGAGAPGGFTGESPGNQRGSYLADGTDARLENKGMVNKVREQKIKRNHTYIHTHSYIHIQYNKP